jgi:hypothetical protein
MFLHVFQAIKQFNISSYAELLLLTFMLEHLTPNPMHNNMNYQVCYMFCPRTDS